MLDTTKARRRYDALVSASTRRTFTATAWYGMAMRLWKAARTTEGGYRLTLEARAVDCEERAKRAARKASRNAASFAGAQAVLAAADLPEAPALDESRCRNFDCDELVDDAERYDGYCSRQCQRDVVGCRSAA